MLGAFLVVDKKRGGKGDNGNIPKLPPCLRSPKRRASPAGCAVTKHKRYESVTCPFFRRRYAGPMREPKFSDAPCFGKEFDAASKICRVCLANKLCQRKYFRAFAAPGPLVPEPTSSLQLLRRKTSFPPRRLSIPMRPSA